MMKGYFLSMCLESAAERYGGFGELLPPIHGQEGRRRDKTARLGRVDALFTFVFTFENIL